MGWYRWDGPDLVLEVRVLPRAKRNAFAVTAGQRLRIRLTAAPVDGKANAALRAFLAEAFAVPRSAVRLEQGAPIATSACASTAPGRYRRRWPTPAYAASPARRRDRPGVELSLSDRGNPDPPGPAGV